MPLFWISLAFLAGLVLGRDILFPAWGWGLLVLPAVGLAVLEVRRAGTPGRLKTLTRLPLGVLLAALLLGMARQAAARPLDAPSELAYYNDTGLYRLTGRIVEQPETGPRTLRLAVAVDELVPLDPAGEPGPAQKVSGQLLALVPAGSSLEYGDRVELEGQPLQPALGDGFNPESLAQHGIRTTLTYPHLRLLESGAGSPFQAGLYAVRQQARRILQQILPMPESALLVGILLGIPDDMPQEVVKSFQDSGTAHIWAISGFNIAILSGMVVTFFGRLLPRRRLAATLLALGTIVLYTLLVGASPSVVRAAVMGTVGMFGARLARRQTGLNSLAFAAALMSLFEPLMPWNISFQLSFLATLGLVAFGEPLRDLFQGWLERRLGQDRALRIAGPVGEYVLLTLAAQAATLPVTVVSFGRLSLSAVLANPLVLPIQPAVMVLGGLALLGGLVALPLGQLLALLAWPGLAYTIKIAGLLAGLPGGVVVGQVGPWAAALLYLGLGGIALGLHWPGLWAGRLKPGFLLLGIFLLVGAAWRTALVAPDGRLHLLALESGGPPAVLLRTPGGQFVGINGGSQADSLGDELGQRLPPFSSGLSAWIITASSPSPLEGLAALSPRFTPRRLLLAGALPESAARTRLLEDLQQAGVEIVALEQGQTIDLDGGVHLSLLADTPDGAGLLLEYGSFRALVPGGAPLKSLGPAGISGAQLIILGPADLETLAPADWQRAGAGLVVWSRLGPEISAPGWENLARCGWIEASSDGQLLWIESGIK